MHWHETRAERLPPFLSLLTFISAGKTEQKKDRKRVLLLLLLLLLARQSENPRGLRNLKSMETVRSHKKSFPNDVVSTLPLYRKAPVLEVRLEDFELFAMDRLRGLLLLLLSLSLFLVPIFLFLAFFSD